MTPEDYDTEIRNIDLTVESEGFDYQVGQSIGILVPGPHEFGEKEHLRLYSIAGGSETDDGKAVISLCVKRCFYIDDYSGERYKGIASNYLCDLSPDEKLSFIGPFDLAFSLPENKNANLLMIGMGTGIAPFRAFVKHIYGKLGGWEGKVRLYHGAKTGLEMPYLNDQNADLKFYYDEETFKAFQAVSPRPYMDAPIDLERALEQSAGEVWEMLQDPNTYVYVAGIQKVRDLLDNALAKIAGSEEKYAEQKAKIIASKRWAEMIY
jgi:ferredoxin--NADP+ reductase